MAGSKSAKEGKGGGGKSPPKSNFASAGKFKKSPDFMKNMKKDNRHWLIGEGHSAGIATMYFKKFNKDEEAYIGPWLKLLDDNPEMKEELGIDAILFRRGEDGNTALTQNPETDYAWRIMVFVIGEDNNTVERREQLMNGVIAHFNLHANAPLFRYPRKCRFGIDRTEDPMTSCGSALLNKDVIGLLLSAYSDNTLEDLKGYDEIMKAFWGSVEDGVQAIDEYVIDFGGEQNETNDNVNA
jgi:hypothetical protein